MAPPRVRITPELREALLDLYPNTDENKLAERLGVGRDVVRRWIARHVPAAMRRRQGQRLLPARPDLDRALDVMLEHDLSISDAARVCGVPKASLRDRANALRQRGQLPLGKWDSGGVGARSGGAYRALRGERLKAAMRQRSAGCR